MSKRHYFKVNEDFSSRAMARMYGLQKDRHEEWYIVEGQRTTSEQRSNLKSAERAFTKLRIIEEQSKIQFAGEKAGQKPGDQVRGTEKAHKSKRKHPFQGKLVGGDA